MSSEETGAFAARLKQLRTRAALSQRDLARRAAIDESTIVRLEAGGQPPRPSTIRKLARALKVKPMALTVGGLTIERVYKPDPEAQVRALEYALGWREPTDAARPQTMAE